MRYLSRIAKRFYRHEGGLAFIEFTFVMPFLFLLVFAGTEITRAILIKQKVEQAGYTLATIISVYNAATLVPATGEITWPDLRDNVMPTFDRIMQPYNNPNLQQAIVTYVERSPALPPNYSNKIKWQVTGGSGNGMWAEDIVSIVNQMKAGDIRDAIDCAEDATDDTERETCVQAILDQAPTYVEPFASVLDEISTNVTMGYIVVEIFYQYQPILETLLMGLNAAAPYGVDEQGNPLVFTFSLPEHTMKKQVFLGSRYDPLLSLPPIYPCCS